jgi:cytochrome c
VYHLVSGERANFPDGHSEFHRFLHTNPPNDAAQIKNLVVWLLSL